MSYDYEKLKVYMGCDYIRWANGPNDSGTYSNILVCGVWVDENGNDSYVSNIFISQEDYNNL